MLIEQAAIEAGGVPVDIIGAGMAGDYVSLKDYRNLTVVIQQGAWAGGTAAVTLKQATDVAGTGEKALSFSTRWTQVALTGTGYTETVVSADTFDLDTANTINVLEVDASDLDVDGGFDCVRVDVASPGANSDLLCVTYVLTGARYASVTPLPDPKVD